MGCASAKHVSTVQNEEEAQKGKNYQNGDVFGDEYKIKTVEEVKYMKNGEDEQKIAARNQENLSETAVMRTGIFGDGTGAEWESNEDRSGSKQEREHKERTAGSNVRAKSSKEVPGLVHPPRANIHISESQQEFFRMLDEKIEKGRDYCSEEEDIT